MQRIIIISGQQGSGKTTLLGNLISELKTRGIKPAGFLAEGFWEQNFRSHFELVDVKTKNRILFCTRKQHLNWEKTGHFYINPDALFFGEKILDPSAVVHDDFIAIDEIGPFELSCKGWKSAIMGLLCNLPAKPMIWVVREKLLQTVTEYFGIQPEMIISTGENQPEWWIEKVAALIQNYQ